MVARCNIISITKQNGPTFVYMLFLITLIELGTISMATKHGICEAYYERYVALAKTGLLSGYGWY